MWTSVGTSQPMDHLDLYLWVSLIILAWSRFCGNTCAQVPETHRSRPVMIQVPWVYSYSREATNDIYTSGKCSCMQKLYNLQLHFKVCWPIPFGPIMTLGFWGVSTCQIIWYFIILLLSAEYYYFSWMCLYCVIYLSMTLEISISAKLQDLLTISRPSKLLSILYTLCVLMH